MRKPTYWKAGNWLVDMANDHERNGGICIEQVLLFTGYLMEETSPEFAMLIEPIGDAQ